MNQDFHRQQRRGRRRMFDYDTEMAHGRRRPSAGRGPRRGGMQQQILNLGPSYAARPRMGRPPKKRRRRVAKRVLLSLGVMVLAVLGAVFGWVGCGLCTVYDDPNNEPPASQVKSANIPEYTGKGIICGLICGIDYDNEEATGFNSAARVGRTDMILYMMYDTAANKANFLQIPRDTYVGPGAATGGTGKINGLYYHAPDTGDRINALTQVLLEQMGLPTDFYITVDMDAVKELVNIRGGIDVYVPKTVTDPETGGVSLPQGWRRFNARDTEYYLRNRNYGDADITRLAMQQSFYSALYRDFRALSPLDLVMWMQVLLSHIKTGGLDTLQLGGLAQKALNLTGADITFVRPALTGGWYNGQQLVSLAEEDLADVLNTWFRPEGAEKNADELNLQSLPMIDYIGKVETNVRTMAGIQGGEPPRPAA